MGLFDFFKKKKADNLFGREITFHLNNPSKSVLSGCRKGDYVNLWTKPDMDRVNIYAPNSIGSSGQLGTIPKKYFQLIKAHILDQKDFGFSGPSTNNYDATIIDITPAGCTISIRLFSPIEYEQRIKDMIEKDKKAIRIELEKKYKMSKPVNLNFELKAKNTNNLDKVKLKIFDKEYYIEHPYDYKLQLLDDNDMVVAETFSQKDKVFRVIKAHLNEQSLKIEKVEKSNNYLLVLVG